MKKAYNSPRQSVPVWLRLSAAQMGRLDRLAAAFGKSRAAMLQYLVVIGMDALTAAAASPSDAQSVTDNTPVA